MRGRGLPVGSVARRWWWIPFLLVIALVVQAVLLTRDAAPELGLPPVDDELSGQARILFGLIVVSLVLSLVIGIVLGMLWRWFRRRTERAEFERYRLTSEAELARLSRELFEVTNNDERTRELEAQVATAQTRIRFLHKERKNEAVLTRQRVEGLTAQIGALQNRLQELNAENQTLKTDNAELTSTLAQLTESVETLTETQGEPGEDLDEETNVEVDLTEELSGGDPSMVGAADEAT